MSLATYLCLNCEQVSEYDKDGCFTCEKCGGWTINLEVAPDSWKRLSREEKEKEIAIIKKISSYETHTGEKYSSIKEKAKSSYIHNIPVTTCDINKEYKILGPIYYQISDRGTRQDFENKLEEYKDLLDGLEKQGLLSDKSDLRDENIVSLFATLEILDHGDVSASTKDLMGQKTDWFDIAFHIAIEELKKRAYLIGANAIIGMKQDLDLDTNGFQHFYLQIYGTAVEVRDMQNDSLLTREDFEHEINVNDDSKYIPAWEQNKNIEYVEIDTTQSNIDCPICGLNQRSDRSKCWNCGVKFKPIFRENK